MIIKCKRCGMEVTGDFKYRIENGEAFCMIHTMEQSDGTTDFGNEQSTSVVQPIEGQSGRQS